MTRTSFPPRSVTGPVGLAFSTCEEGVAARLIPDAEWPMQLLLSKWSSSYDQRLTQLEAAARPARKRDRTEDAIDMGRPASGRTSRRRRSCN